MIPEGIPTLPCGQHQRHEAGIGIYDPPLPLDTSGSRVRYAGNELVSEPCPGIFPDWDRILAWREGLEKERELVTDPDGDLWDNVACQDVWAIATQALGGSR